MRLLLLLLLLTVVSPAGEARLMSKGGSASSGSSVPFALPTGSVLHYMAASGCSDANAGTSAGAPWCTPNHTMNCGEVIIAASGDYSSTNFGNTFGTVSNCPSTSGGIDSLGGVNFVVLLCGGADLEACHSSGNLWQLNAHRWAIEGFHVSNTGTGSPNRAFNANGCNGFVLHHIAFVNNVVVSAASGFHTDDCGAAGAAAGVDYFAAVGNIAQNASQNSSFCEAAIDYVGPGTLDNAAGTHGYIYGNFTWNDQAPGCVTAEPFDSEGIMFDSFDQRAFNNTGVIANNLVWHAMRYCIQVIPTQTVVDSPTIKIYNNSCYGNLTNIGADNADGEINLNVGNPPVSWSITVRNNIAQSVAADGAHFAFVLDNPNSNAVIGGTGNENIFKSAATSCPGTCDSGNNAVAFNGGSFGTNTYVSPAYTNVSDLTTNYLGAPSCTGFVSTLACMGWNANTQVLTTLTPISDLVPTAGGTSSKGYQLPSTTCASNADYPTWLKGIVYLHWNGSSLSENADLVTKPCGM